VPKEVIKIFLWFWHSAKKIKNEISGIVEQVKQKIRDVDTVFDINSNTLALILPLTGANGAMVVIKKIKDRLPGKWHFGVATYPDNGKDELRFLILQWVRIKNLASYLLSRTLKMLKKDWLNMFGPEPYLVETFVDMDKYKGTCYKAANWLYLGKTKGFAKVGKTYVYHGYKKGVCIYPFCRE
jgi:hypothetical protein